MAEVRTEFTGDASSLAASTKQAQEGINAVLDASNKAAGALGQLNQVAELAAKAQKGLAAASAFLSTGTAAVTVAVKAQTLAFLSSPMAPVAAAVMALGAAYAYLSSKVDEANEKAEKSAELAAQTQRAAEKLGAIKQSLADAEAVATGKTTEEALKLRDTIQKVTDGYAPFIAAKKAAIAAAIEEGTSTKSLEASLKALEAAQAKQVASATLVYDIDVAAKKAAEDKAAADKKAAAAAAARAKREAAAAAEKREEDKKAAEELKRVEKEADDAAEALRQFNEGMIAAAEAQFAPVVNKAATALGSFNTVMEEVDPSAPASDLDKIAMAMMDVTIAFSRGEISAEQFEAATTRAAQATADVTKKKMKETAEAVEGAFEGIASDLASVMSEISARIEASLSETQDKIDDIDSALGDLSESGVNAAQLQGEALVQAYLDGEVAAEDLSDSQKKLIKSELEARKKALKEKEAAEKKAALAAFRIQQGVAIAQAVIGTAQGIIQAFQLGPIAGAAAAVAIGVIGAAQIAMITSQKPSFAAGGFLDAAPTTGVGVTMHPNEAVLNQQGRKALGDQAIIDANNGTLGSGGSGGQPTTIIYKHKPFEYFMRDNIAMNGTIAKATRKGDRVGQVRRGRG